MPPKKTKPAAKAPTRRRRTAEEARHEILAAAQRRLAEGGPEAIRLQDIARDLGRHAVPRIDLVDHIERTATGKVRLVAEPPRE